MKTKNLFRKIILATFVVFLPCMASAQTRLLADLPSGPNVSRVNISETMIKIGTAAIPINAVGPYVALIKSPKNIEIYSCAADKNTKNEASTQFMNMLKGLDYEELLTAEEFGEVNNIYMVYQTDKATGKREASSMIVYNSDPNNLNIVVIHGTFNIDELSSVSVPDSFFYTLFF